MVNLVSDIEVIFVLFSFLQARLNEIITSSLKAVHSSSPEKPWMVDGAGLPANASELLPKLVQSC